MAEIEIPDDLLYTQEDEWARQEQERLVVGVTDYAQDQLGDIVFVELPEPGSSFNQGDSFGVVESVKAVADLYAPVSGEVVEINEALADRPEIVNEDCYGDGWLVALVPSEPGELAGLLSPEGYRKHVDERSD